MLKSIGNVKSKLMLLLLVSLLTTTYFSYRIARRKTASPPFEADRGRNFSQSKLNTSEFGYVLALSYYDQLTGSVANLLSLQCWAHSLGPGVVVVEPFLKGAVLGVDAAHLSSNSSNTQGSVRESVTLYDVYSQKQWEEFTSKNFAAMVSRDYFVSNAPRKLIIVDQVCYGKKRGKCMVCNKRSEKFLQSVEVLKGRYGFTEVRRACYPVDELVKRGDFRELIYQGYSPDKVVVVFNNWGGIQTANFLFRTGITGMQRCDRNRYMRDYPLSERIRRDADVYAREYMPEAISKGYISVMVRLEQYSLRFNKFKGKSREEILTLLETFYGSIMKKVNHIKTELKITNVFLTVDCRKQGSGYFAKNISGEATLMTLLSTSIVGLFNMLYGNSSSLKDWDESFYSISSFRNRGYIAMLQKHLAANGTCLIAGGGGAFQNTALQLFGRYHPGSKCHFLL